MSAAQDKQKRLAEQLRSNLRKRKAQMRQRDVDEACQTPDQPIQDMKIEQTEE